MLIELLCDVIQQYGFTFVSLKLHLGAIAQQHTVSENSTERTHNLHVIISLSTEPLIPCYFPVQFH